MNRPSIIAMSLGLYDTKTPLNYELDQFVYGVVDGFGEIAILRQEDLLYVTDHWAPEVKSHRNTYTYH